MSNPMRKALVRLKLEYICIGSLGSLLYYEHNLITIE